MSRSSLTTLKLQSILKILFLLVALAMGLVGPGGQTLIWAAPEQNPNLQTIPDRPPDDEPTPAPPGSPPKAGQDNKDKDKGGGKKEADNASPGQPFGTKDGIAGNTAPPAQPEGTGKTQMDQASAQEATSGQGQVQAAQIPVKEDGGSEISSTLTSSSVTQAAVTQSDSNQVTDSANPSLAVEDLPGRLGSLLWLCALGLGIILMVGGVALVKRA